MKRMKKVISYLITEQEDGLKLERILKSKLELSPQEISRAKFRSEGICLNGCPCKVTVHVHAGDRITVCLEEEERVSDQLVPWPSELHILYEDEDVLIVYKPAGVVCHPVGGHYQDTLANSMQYYFQKQGQQVVIRLIGRLDQETSGVVLAAKSQAAASRLSRQREQGIWKKEYLALVQGCPAPLCGTITKPIGPWQPKTEEWKSEESRSREEIKMQVRPDGKTACTHYEVLETRGNCSLVRLWLETGRTHQIRVHMAHLGCHLLGDTLYDPKTEEREEAASGFARAALHAWRLEFCQPFTKESICVEAPLPADFLTYLRQGGFVYDTGCSGSITGHCADRLHLQDG